MKAPPGRSLFLAGLLALSPAVAWPAAPAGEVELPEFSSQVLLDHVKFLAGEDLEGRAAGSPGEGRALDSIASRLEAAGVAPFPPGTRRQTFAISPAPGAPRSANVLGWIEGARADLKDEVIVLGAHVDHLGRTPAGLHPGADDNASGTAVVLEVALALRARAAELGRSVLIVFFGAEEAGLVGSTHFVREGPLAIERVAVMVNVDMIGRLLVDQAELAPWKKLLSFDDAASIGVVGARDRPPFPGIIESVATAAGLKVFGTRSIPLLSKVIDNLSHGRSDHAPFEAVGVPTLFFGSGESDDYHRPSDTVDKVRPDLMARRARVVFGVVAALSIAPGGTLPRPANAVPPPTGRPARE
jgi:peptidase M28-like protein